MKKKILVLTGSPRKGGNSDLLADAFIDGAKSAGYDVIKFEAGLKNINGCIACETCFSKGTACSFDDDFNELAPLLERADMLVFATPLYWFSFPAQIKAAIDKFYAFSASGKPLKIKTSMLLACGETDDAVDFEGLVRSYELICNYKEWEDRGRLLVLNVNQKGDIRNTDELNKARELGQSLTF